MSVLFSVVTVVRNDLTGLKKTRKSLENQRYTKWLHIVIDGSTYPLTRSYLKSLPKENTLYISEPDSGIYNAMNKAWKLADPTSYVYYLNARDVFADSNSLWEANKALRTNLRSKWGCTTHEEIQQDGTAWVCKLVSPPSIPNQLYAYGYRSHQAVVMKANFIAQLGGFNEKYKLAADWDLIARALVASKPKVWSYSLGRFELGGFSSDRMLDAHAELKYIRHDYLIKSLRHRLLDDLWCAIYLRFFGFKNYLTPVVNAFFHSDQLKRRKRKDFANHLPKRAFSFKLGSVIITFSRRQAKKNFFLRLKDRNRRNLLLWLHRNLLIQPYSNPNSQENL
jgi:glycosyltransferase involved in cell wall biosynthesis